MRKNIILLFCCGLIIDMVGCGGNAAPPPTETPADNGIENNNNGNAAHNGGRNDKVRKRASPNRERGSNSRADHDQAIGGRKYRAKG